MYLLKEEDKAMRKLFVQIEINGSSIYVGEITGNDSNDACGYE